MYPHLTGLPKPSEQLLSSSRNSLNAWQAPVAVDTGLIAPMPPSERPCDLYSLSSPAMAAKMNTPSKEAKCRALTWGSTEENEKRCFTDLSPTLCPLPWRSSKLPAFRGSSGRSQMCSVCSAVHQSLSPFSTRSQGRGGRATGGSGSWMGVPGSEKREWEVE